MSSLGTYKKIITNDYPEEYKELMDKLGYSINTSMELLFLTLAQRVSLADNVLCDIKTLEVKVDATGKPTSPLVFSVSNPNISSIRGMHVIQAVNKTNGTGYPTSCPFISYSITQPSSQVQSLTATNNTQNKFTITANNISGLIPNNIYNLTVVIYG